MILHLVEALWRRTLFGRLREIERPSERKAARVVVGWTAVSVVIVWVSALMALIESRGRAVDDTGLVVDGLARIVAEQARNELSKTQLFLNMVVTHYQQHHGLNPRRDIELEQYVEQFRRRTGGRAAVRLIARNGDVFAIGDPDAPALANVADRDYFKVQTDAATKGFFIGKPILSRADHRWVLPVSMPLIGAPSGYLALSVTIDFDTFVSLFEAGRPKPNGSIALVSADGTVLFRVPTDERFIGASVVEGDLWRHHLSQRPRGVAEISRSFIKEANLLVAYETMTDFSLAVVVTTPIDDILVQWSKFLGIALRIGALLSLVSLCLAHYLVKRIAELSATRNELERLAVTDSLTGLFNRRQFWERGGAEIARLSRYPHPLTVLLIDLDHFKSINDRFGHAAGDETLRRFAAQLRGLLRQTDITGRLGGEEFAILLPETTLASARSLAERIRRSVESMLLVVGENRFAVTISIGVAGTLDPAATMELLLERADQALYRAKAEGRNRVVSAGETSADPGVVLPSP